ncbi:MAG TPA: 4'-phosphopantetheinyl transferase superfamily protein [Acholeplasma sp.]|jgi:phosphopantetheine--protein transferase-like protein|nr:4'-phosphopantetheinyl transferase superfamily protein [Acholeplasmatales bacterium]HHV33221.1 4'-phosphopantetheinyl transferase superfamily protein [Acholeplasma sp.]
MLKVYITKVFDDAFVYFDYLNLNIQERINKNKDDLKKKQMITAELLLRHALIDSGYKGEVSLEYTPKPILKDSGLSISKSHSNDYVMVAVSNENVGCDIEKIRIVKNPTKVLSEEEFENYKKQKEDKKAEVFTLYWTAKESYIKYHGSLTKEYKEIFFNIERTINNFNGGKIEDLYCYQSFFNEYSFAIVSKMFTVPEVVFVSEKELKGDI